MAASGTPLSLRELTVALAARQHLLERAPLEPAEAIRRLSPLQGQDAPSPYVGLAARVDGFTREHLEAAIEAGEVVKTTALRTTLHLVAADEYPAYAEVARRFRLRSLTKKHDGLDLAKVARELRRWLRTPRTNVAIRTWMSRYDGIEDEGYEGILMARTLLPLVQLPPAGFWADRGRGVLFAVDPRPRPPLDEAAALVLRRYLAAFGPASHRDARSWADATQADLAGGWERLETVTHHDEKDRVLHDLPGAPLPPGDTPLPVRFLGRWDQALLAYADRERIIPAAVAPLKLTLSGDQTVTVDGRVAASWSVERTAKLARLTVTPHVPLRRGARGEIRAEAKQVTRFVAPGLKPEVGFS